MADVDLDDVAAVLTAFDPVRPNRRRRTRADAERWIVWNKRNYADHGYGLWIIEAHDGRFVGDCGLGSSACTSSPRRYQSSSVFTAKLCLLWGIPIRGTTTPPGIAAGCDVVTVQRALGHSKATTTLDTYSHLWPTAEDRTRTAADGMLAAALSPPKDSPRTLEG